MRYLSKPTCAEVARLVAEGIDRTLGPIERVRVRIHLWVCSNCRTFGRQMELIRAAMRRGF